MSGHTHCELVGPVEVGERLGVKRETVWTWKHRGRLPAPVGVVSGVPVWCWPDVAGWAVETGRLK